MFSKHKLILLWPKMTQYNTLNIKLSSLQLNKLRSEIKNGTEVTLNLSSKVIGNCNDETNFPHNLLLTNTQVSRFRKAFANGSSTNIKLSKTQLYKIKQSGGFFKSLAESVLITLGLETAEVLLQLL